MTPLMVVALVLAVAVIIAVLEHPRVRRRMERWGGGPDSATPLGTGGEGAGGDGGGGG